MNATKDKTSVVALRVHPEFKKQIEQAAAKDYRSVSGFIEVCIRLRLKIIAAQEMAEVPEIGV